MIDKSSLNETLRLHNLWLNNDSAGICANLSWADLSGCNLSRADLSEADLRGCNLSHANLSRANLSGCNLRRANLTEANLTEANLTEADLTEANLTEANLSWANLTEANLSEANLSDADLSWANLSDANLSGATGLLNSAEWLKSNFEQDELGVIVYKRFGDTEFDAPENWVIESGSFITEVCNPCRTIDCACGVNFATRGWCNKSYQDATLWRCRIRWIDLAGVIVPYNTDGKARCERLELLEVVTDEN
jgi:hypothetical protein